VLAKAMCQIATQATSDQDLDQAVRVAKAAHAALAGPAELAARTSLIERITFAANVVDARGRTALAEQSANALDCFRGEWPEFGAHLTASDFATGIEKWEGRSGKWPYLVKMMRKAGMTPPTARTLLTEWSRHLANRRAHAWSWDGTRWVATPARPKARR